MIQYNGASLVPDLSQSLNLALGIGQDIKQQRQEAQAQELAGQFDTSAPIYSDENREILTRLQTLNPQMAQTMLQLSQVQDQALIQETERNAAEQSAFFTSLTFAENDEQVRSEILRRARGLVEEGAHPQQLSDLQDLISLQGDDLSLAVRRKAIEFGDAEAFTRGLVQPEGVTDIGKLRQDLNNGLISPDQYAQATGDLLAPSGESFDNETTLRKELNADTDDFAKQDAAFGRIVASAEDPSAAGDLALIFNYMKLLDPGSTVREGEFATAQNSGGVDDRIISQYNQVINGERLTVDQRTDFVGRSERLYEGALQSFDTLSERYRELADRNNLNFENVLIDRATMRNRQQEETTDDTLESSTGIQFRRVE